MVMEGFGWPCNSLQPLHHLDQEGPEPRDLEVRGTALVGSAASRCIYP